MIVVLHECFREQALWVDCATGRRAYKAVESRTQIRIVALLQDVHQSAEQVGREVHVDMRCLVVQQGHALVQPSDQVLARQRKRQSLSRASRREIGAHQLLLQVEGFLELRANLSEGRHAAVQEQQTLF